MWHVGVVNRALGADEEHDYSFLLLKIGQGYGFPINVGKRKLLYHLACILRTRIGVKMLEKEGKTGNSENCCKPLHNLLLGSAISQTGEGEVFVAQVSLLGV